MAKETRTIYFDQAELVRAAQVFCQLHERAVPGGWLTAVLVEPETVGRVRLRFDADGRPPAEVALSYAEMAAGLIAYCAKVAIPLPRYGLKRLKPAGEGLALIIHLPGDAGEANAAAALDKRTLLAI